MTHYFCRRLLIVICAALLVAVLACKPTSINPDALLTEQPRLFPDYSGLTFPVNIAAPSFIVEEDGEKYDIELGNENQVYVKLQNKSGKFRIPLKKWKKLLKENKGSSFYMRISVLKENKWTQYTDIVNHISSTEIDSFLVYRLLYPGYELWNEMGIYQRNLTNYDEKILLDNKNYEKGCINCHTFNKNSSETMMVHVRGDVGGTLISKDRTVRKIDLKAPGLELPATYPAWHPGARYIAYSTNNVSQFFHSTGTKTVEVSDSASDLVILDTEKNILLTDSLIYGAKWMETFPAWSPNGKHLYFCRAKMKEKGTRLDSIRYDLCRIEFNDEAGSFGKFEMVYEASQENKSISLPRISPDGNSLLFAISDYGNFSIWHPESELGLLNLNTGEIRIMDEINSNDVESYPSWSLCGNWIVFSSKRIDGLWAHPYIAYFDTKTGKAAKPFILPQKDPEFYKTFTQTFNRPELITTPVECVDEMVRTANSIGEKVSF